MNKRKGITVEEINKLEDLANEYFLEMKVENEIKNLLNSIIQKLDVDTSENYPLNQIEWVVKRRFNNMLSSGPNRILTNNWYGVDHGNIK